MRTTLDIADPVLERLKTLQRTQNQTLSQIASALLAEALSQHDSLLARQKTQPLLWTTSDMKALLDISDKEALNRALDTP